MRRRIVPFLLPLREKLKLDSSLSIWHANTVSVTSSNAYACQRDASTESKAQPRGTVDSHRTAGPEARRLAIFAVSEHLRPEIGSMGTC